MHNPTTSLSAVCVRPTYLYLNPRIDLRLPRRICAAFWSSSMLKGMWWSSRSARGHVEDSDPSRVYCKLVGIS